MTQLFEKRGRRYIPWGNGQIGWHDHDEMAIGEFRLIHCPAPGHYRQRGIVTPDRAAFLAAAEEAVQAMEEAMTAAAMARPQPAMGVLMTPQQMAIINRYRAEMAAAGAHFPHWWTNTSAADIARAGIEAVRQKLEAQP